MTNKQSWEEDYYLTFGYIDPKTFQLGKKFVERLLASKSEQMDRLKEEWKGCHIPISKCQEILKK